MGPRYAERRQSLGQPMKDFPVWQFYCHLEKFPAISPPVAISCSLIFHFYLPLIASDHLSNIFHRLRSSSDTHIKASSSKLNKYTIWFYAIFFFSSLMMLRQGGRFFPWKFRPTQNTIIIKTLWMHALRCNVQRDKFKQIDDTFKRVIGILVKRHISTRVFWRGKLELLF